MNKHFRNDTGVKNLFGESAYRKLVDILDTCCGGGNPSILPYKVYTAFLNQSGTNAPTADIIENTLDININFEYTNTGNYLAIIDQDIFNSPQEYITISGNIGGEGAGAIPVFFNALSIQAIFDNLPSDDVLGHYYPCILEIRKYN